MFSRYHNVPTIVSEEPLEPFLVLGQPWMYFEVTVDKLADDGVLAIGVCCVCCEASQTKHRFDVF